MEDKGLKNALKSSEVERQTGEISKIENSKRVSNFENGDLFRKPEEAENLFGDRWEAQDVFREQGGASDNLSGTPNEVSDTVVCTTDLTSGKGKALAAQSEPLFKEMSGLGSEERGRGRPKGAKNKSTKEWVEYFTNRFESPLVALGKLYTQDTKSLAREMCCDRLDALKIQVAAASSVLPYVHQKQPVALEIATEELPTIQIYTSPTIFNQINNGQNCLKKEIIVDGIASTTTEEIPLKINDLCIEDKTESEKKV